jgi:LPS export ABC transporter protein LptC
MPKLHRSISYFVNLAPVISMGALALFSVALVKQSPNSRQVSPSHISIDDTEHNYYLKQFFTSQFNSNGAISSYIRGASTFHFEKSEQLTVNDFNFYFSNNPISYRGEAKKAIMQDAGNAVALYRGVTVERSIAGLTSEVTFFKSDYLHLTQQPAVIASNLPVKIYQGNKTIMAGSLKYEHAKQQLHMAGRVKIQINPKH